MKMFGLTCISSIVLSRVHDFLPPYPNPIPYLNLYPKSYSNGYPNPSPNPNSYLNPYLNHTQTPNFTRKVISI